MSMFEAPTSVRRQANRHRWAIFLLFFTQGITLSSWVSRTPAIRDLVRASTAEMGLILFGLSVGAMVSVLSAAPLIRRFGTKALSVTGTCGVTLSMPVVGVGAVLHSGLAVAAGLLLYGLGIGSVEVALNVDGAEVEKQVGKQVLPALHGSFSLGTMVGAVAGIFFARSDFSVTWHLFIVGFIGCVGLIAAVPRIPPGTGKSLHAPTIHSDDPQRRSLWSDRRLLLIGAIVLAMALAEGTANDWLPILMVDEHGFDAGWGSASYAIFAAAMTVGRFAGAPLIERLGRAVVLGSSAILGAAGLAGVIWIDYQPLVLVAVVLWGIGASLGFPVALSAAGSSGPDSPARVSFVATVGYLAFLAGPPVIGVVGEHLGLRAALVIPLVMVALAATATPVVRSIPAVRLDPKHPVDSRHS